jgi:hypothetical protein
MNLESVDMAMFALASPARCSLQEATQKATDSSPWWTHSSTASTLSSVRRLALEVVMVFKICAAPKTTKRPLELVCKKENHEQKEQRC